MKSAFSVFVGLLVISASHAASVSDVEYKKISESIRMNGYSPVLINIKSIPLSRLGSDLTGVISEIESRTNRLKAELGAGIVDGGVWSNGIGQVELKLNAKGLETLRRTVSAESFSAGAPWYTRSSSSNLDGRLNSIDEALKGGPVDVEIILNTENFQFELSEDGSIAVLNAGDGVKDARQALLKKMTSLDVIGLSSLQSEVFSANSPIVKLKLTRQGIEKLSLEKSVRSMRLVGYKERRQSEVLNFADAAKPKNGQYDILITIDSPVSGGLISKSNEINQTEAYTKAARRLVSKYGVDLRHLDFIRMGIVAAKGSEKNIAAMVAAKDPLIKQVSLNRIAGYPQLNQSGFTMNLPGAWNVGYVGSGQNIAILDTGVQLNHDFFKDASGNSRIFFQACFGTNSGNAQSVCPAQDANGDSPLNYPNSGAPTPSNLCSPYAEPCFHGTHVAGIAAGRYQTTLPTPVQGVAYGARILAIKVSSYDPTTAPNLPYFTEDIVAALNAIMLNMSAGTTNNPFTVNISSGTSSTYGGQCNYFNAAATAAIDNLRNLGVPVVVAAGNSGSYSSNSLIAWPACIDGAIKVAALDNDSSGATLATYSKLPLPSSFPGQDLWAAPGGGNTKSILSSSGPGASELSGASGTSMAAPQIAGLYALVKSVVPGISVSGVTAYLQASASLTVNLPSCEGSCQLIPYKRPLMPNY
ncbi:S8 family serine peptidase [uncultured Xylophilus sp.]|uniref:S8 family peptidase n=1 Tax=uncultured Xylophilus sp. TaxID=296832 RepID=UPI0025EFDD64|nr:S8 family serine peptidase [uncultured Xylophilus sp.]